MQKKMERSNGNASQAYNHKRRRSLFTVLALFLALYLAMDPFEKSVIANFPEFEAYKIDMPPWSQTPKVFDHEDRLQNAEIKFKDQIHGPESIAFDHQGRGPYTGVADGRVVFWDGFEWKDFAYTSPNWSEELCACRGSVFANIPQEHICGRPLGLRFDKRNGDLYIADAYFGLLVVGRDGGQATRLVSEIDGVPLKFTNDLDIDSNGVVYFTHSSTTYHRRNFLQLVFSAKPSGSVIKYDTNTKKTKILLSKIQFPNGLSLNKDEYFLVYSDSSTGRLRRYWIKGAKAGETDTFAVLPGYPDNVRRNKRGEFWVGLHCRRSLYSHILGLYPRVRKAILKMPIPLKYQYMAHIGGGLHGLIVKYSEDGELVDILEDKNGKIVRAVSEVEERDGKLWIGSILNSYIAVY